ncbi:hypothetical protein PHO31112_04310 [Pandoraea horticolens]|uniref:Uncharacterized protein n=1 Tax=Pandoraea horticolens TaxID=2508298 RepID=A0A5E4Y6I4_9BURK|nr:hypothetical protein [Pandoraea horticolens]VVE44127.1 hypothetical protein PHO31112_04310 [Pandoraea horticolens]
MKTYPIRVARSRYRGADPKKQAKAADHNRDAALLESRTNELLLTQKEPVRSYLWMELSIATGLSYDRVAELGYSIDCGSGGFTAWRHDMTYSEAMNASESENVDD